MYLGLHSGAKILKRRYSLEGKTLEIDSSLKVDYSSSTYSILLLYVTYLNPTISDQGGDKAGNEAARLGKSGENWEFGRTHGSRV